MSSSMCSAVESTLVTGVISITMYLIGSAATHCPRSTSAGVPLALTGDEVTVLEMRKESTFVTRHVRKAPDSPPNGSPNDISSTVTSSPVSANGTPADVDRGQWVAAEPIKYIVIEMTPVTSVDSTALHMLKDMHRDLKERGIRLCLSTVGNRVEDTLKRS